jgi:hypothetical protein
MRADCFDSSAVAAAVLLGMFITTSGNGSSERAKATSGDVAPLSAGFLLLRCKAVLLINLNIVSLWSHSCQQEEIDFASSGNCFIREVTVLAGCV